MKEEKVVEKPKLEIKWEVATFEDKYCPSCDYGFDEPQDSCLCNENCGAIGCQGSNVPQND